MTSVQTFIGTFGRHLFVYKKNVRHCGCFIGDARGFFLSLLASPPYTFMGHTTFSALLFLFLTYT